MSRKHFFNSMLYESPAKSLQSLSAQIRERPGSNHSQSLMASNFEALWPTDSKFSELKDLNPFLTDWKVQEASRMLRIGFALSKWPHLLHKMGFVDSLTQTTVKACYSILALKKLMVLLRFHLHIIQHQLVSSYAKWFLIQIHGYLLHYMILKIFPKIIQKMPHR